jgi:tRNA(Arg) A34 adenosine deaminase TadA
MKSRDHPPSGTSVGRRRFLAGLAGTSFALGALGGATAIDSWRNHKSADGDQGSRELSASATTARQAKVPALDHDRYMRAAITQARLVPELPFGAVLVDIGSGEIVAEGHNRSQPNPTFHGEIDVINRLAADASDVDWSALVLYTTAEPCPMCQSAIEWAGIAAVVYGSSIPFLKRSGWCQIDLRAAAVIERTPFRKTALLGGVLEQECNELFLAVPEGRYRGADSE